MGFKQICRVGISECSQESSSTFIDFKMEIMPEQNGTREKMARFFQYLRMFFNLKNIYFQLELK